MNTDDLAAENALLRNEIVSCFSMTEPQGGADPKVFTTRAVQDGDEWVINGEKWFSSFASMASFIIVMALTDPDAPPYERYSMFVVPGDTPGINVLRDVGLVGVTLLSLWLTPKAAHRGKAPREPCQALRTDPRPRWWPRAFRPTALSLPPRRTRACRTTCG